jgi:flagellar L-ring protein FlgH
MTFPTIKSLTKKSLTDNIFRMSLPALCVLLATACTVGPDEKPDDPEYAPVLAQQQVYPSPNPGGIYQQGYGESLFMDRRAAKVGDVITIVLSETTSTTKAAKSKVKKNSKVNFNDGTVLDVAPTFKNLALPTEIDQSRDFDGDVQAEQNNALNGTIAVSVYEVMPNGLLLVRGEKWMTLNRGEEFIRIRGLIRQEDIRPDNTISSTKLADARITYSGSGELADASRQGWLGRFFNSKWWPF